MYCPFKFNEKTLDADGYPKKDACQCEKQGCELWEPFTGTCALRTQAFLAGREVSIKDMEGVNQ